MIIERVQQYWEEHADQLGELTESGQADIVELTRLYREALKTDPQAVYKEIDTITGALEKSDFIEYCEGNINTRTAMIEAIKETPDNNFLFLFPTFDTEQLEALSREELRNATQAHITTEEQRQILIESLQNELARYEENYNNSWRFIEMCLSTQLDILGDGDRDGDRIRETIDAIARAWYPDSAPAQDQTQPEAISTARATIRHADIVEYPLDKPNANIWNMLKEDTGGQLRIDFNMLPKQPELQAYAIYSINFDELGSNLKISKTLTPYDKRVYIAVSALFNAGNDVITLTQIYYAMGYTGKPAKKQIERINESVEKMRKAYVTLDNTAEANALKNVKRFKYDDYLLPLKSITAVVNGKLSDRAIKLYEEPPLIRFAKQRNQVTTITVKLLQSPISKTDGNLAIDDYLLEQISRKKRTGTKPFRLLYDTIYKRTNITTKLQRSRAPEKIKTYLDYYEQEGFIKGYTIQPDGITIEP